MTSHSRITVVAPTEEECADLTKMIEGLPDFETRSAPGKLSRMNGTAVAMTHERGIVLARIDAPTEEDVEGIERLARSDQRAADMIVLSDADLPLALARRLMQAGVAEVLPTPADAEEVRRAVARLARPVQLPAVYGGKQPGRILTVTRARGGIGATTLAVNLASSLAQSKGRFRKTAGASVALVDFDLQFGAVSSFLDLPARDTLYELAAEGQIPDAAYLDDEMETAADGLRVLTAPARFMPIDAISEAQVAAILETLRDRHDFVVVDLPHGLVDWVQAVVDRSDQVMLVTDSTVPSIRQAKRLIDFFHEESPGVPFEIVINHESKPMVRAKHHVEASKLLERPFRTWLPSDPKTARAAVDRGVPITATGRRSALGKSISRLARGIEDQFGAASARRAI